MRFVLETTCRYASDPARKRREVCTWIYRTVDRGQVTIFPIPGEVGLDARCRHAVSGTACKHGADDQDGDGTQGCYQRNPTESRPVAMATRHATAPLVTPNSKRKERSGVYIRPTGSYRGPTTPLRNAVGLTICTALWPATRITLTAATAATDILIGMGNRILRRGNVVALIQAFENVVDEKQAELDAIRMLQGQFDLNDFSEQIHLLEKMGPLTETAETIPGLAEALPGGAEIDDGEFDRIGAIVSSMTEDERRYPEGFVVTSSEAIVEHHSG